MEPGAETAEDALRISNSILRQTLDSGRTISVSDANTGTRLIDGVEFDSYSAIAGLQIVRGRKFVDGADEVICDTAWADQNKLAIGAQLPMYEWIFSSTQNIGLARMVVHP